MATFITASLLEIPSNLKAFGANNVLKTAWNPAAQQRQTQLVMGAGAAKAVLERWPGIDALLARAIEALKLERNQPYGFVTASSANGQLVGAFQSKQHWRDPSTVELITFSTGVLNNYLDSHPAISVAIAYPGIGLGGLKERDVQPILKTLPDRVTICKLR